MRRTLDPIRQLVLWVMLSPFLMLALMPAAVMPSRTAADGIVFVLCSDHGPVQLAIDPATGQPVKKLPAGASERCPWAAAHVAALDHSPTVLPHLVRARLGREASVTATVLVAARATGLPPATGPPFLI